MAAIINDLQQTIMLRSFLVYSASMIGSFEMEYKVRCDSAKLISGANSDIKLVPSIQKFKQKFKI